MFTFRLIAPSLIRLSFVPFRDVSDLCVLDVINFACLPFADFLIMRL